MWGLCSPVNCVTTTNITILIYNWLLKYILTILPAAEPGPLEVRGDGERPRDVLPVPGILASPTLADNWLIPTRQNVLVRGICTLTLLICSRGNCPSYPFLLMAGCDQRLLWAVTDSPPAPAPPMGFLTHPGIQVQAEGAEVQSRACASNWFVKGQESHPQRRPFTAVWFSEVQSRVPGKTWLHEFRTASLTEN